MHGLYSKTYAYALQVLIFVRLAREWSRKSKEDQVVRKTYEDDDGEVDVGDLMKKAGFSYEVIPGLKQFAARGGESYKAHFWLRLVWSVECYKFCSQVLLISCFV